MKDVARIGAVVVFGLIGWTSSAALVAAPASACLISPGTTSCAPDLLTLSSSAQPVAQKSGTINSNPPGITANYVETVYRDPSNNVPGNSCAPNCLTWLLQVSSIQTSTDTIEKITIAHFSGWVTDMGIDTSTPYPTPYSATGTIAPTNVERSNDGNVLRWDFNQGGGEIAAGQSSSVLEVQTNSTVVTLGTVTIQNGESGTGPGLSPDVPESTWVPALGLVGTALLGGQAVRRRHLRRSGGARS
jgi:hypothetical protein